MDELIFAIPTHKLWTIIPYQEKGLIHGNSDVLNRIAQNGLFRKRSELEEDPSFKQIIPYAIISFEDAENNQSYFLFTRTSNQTEKRLHNQLTLGVGGHMNPREALKPNKQYFVAELKRELYEEIKLLDGCCIENVDFIGIVNDDTIPVGKVHIGLLCNIKVSSRDILVNETDKMTAEWVDKAGLFEYYYGMETWTQIVFDSYIK